MDATYDGVIVGGGHNGLVCAAYLARARRRVLLLEAAPQVGGAAVTQDIAPGFRVSACAHILNLLHPRIVGDLDLTRRGLAFSVRDMPTVLLAEDGRHITLSRDKTSTADSLQRHSAADAAALPEFRARLMRFARTLKPFLTAVPARLGGGEWRDRLGLLKLGWAIRRLGREDMREFLRIVGINVADIVEEVFETDLLKGGIAFDGVLGTHLGPRSPNSVLTLLYRLTGETAGLKGAPAHPRGGMGTVTRALAEAAGSAGAEIRTGASVARILVENERVTGVELASGERVSARFVISNADPRTTFLSLLGPEHLDTGFVRRVRNIRMRGTAAKLNLALDGLPSFKGLGERELGGRMVIAPSVDYVESAFNPSKYGEYSDQPAVEITIPSVHDPTLAPEGKHVLSAIVQYAPYDLKQGWDAAREAFADRAIRTIAAFAPDLPERIMARQMITPLDLERDYRMAGGHWHHGELAIDQLFMLRPVPGCAQYATPVPGLYLCGAGAHPGGGVMGAAGMNAARRVIEGEKTP